MTAVDIAGLRGRGHRRHTVCSLVRHSLPPVSLFTPNLAKPADACGVSRRRAGAVFALAAWAVELQLTDLSNSGYDPAPLGREVFCSVTLENDAGDLSADAVTRLVAVAIYIGSLYCYQ